MTHDEKRLWLIKYLLKENPEYAGIGIPYDDDSQWHLLRSLMNVRPAVPAGIEDRSIIISDIGEALSAVMDGGI